MPGIFLSSIYRGNCLVANNRCGWFALQWELCSCMLLQGAWHTISSDGDTDLDKIDLDKCKWTTKNQYILVIGSFLLVVLALLPLSLSVATLTYPWLCPIPNGTSHLLNPSVFPTSPFPEFTVGLSYKLTILIKMMWDEWLHFQRCMFGLGSNARAPIRHWIPVV